MNKFIADSGHCARRKADDLIAAGKVMVNGQVVTAMGTRIDPQTDTVSVEGQVIRADNRRFYLALHKPAGYLTARDTGKNRRTIYHLLPPAYQSGDPAGRLDKETSGLLIFSNDGDFIQRIAHPRYHWPKHYKVQLNRTLGAGDKKRLKEGITLLPEQKLARMAAVETLPEPNCYEVVLITGYNRQIRRSFEALGFEVKKLVRTAFGPVRLAGLKSGGVRPLSADEVQTLLADRPAPPPEHGQHRSQDEYRKSQKQAQHPGQDQAKQQGQCKNTPSGRWPR